LRGCAEACVFHLFGGVLASRDWSALAASPGGDPLDAVIGSLAVARALGYGRWALEAYVPEETLVLRSAGTYESIYGKLLATDQDEPYSLGLQGAAFAIMLLAHRLDWQPTAQLDSYASLRRDLPWICKQTHSVARGDAMDRVVLMRK
jgi:hypothetical protein